MDHHRLADMMAEAEIEHRDHEEEDEDEEEEEGMEEMVVADQHDDDEGEEDEEEEEEEMVPPPFDNPPHHEGDDNPPTIIEGQGAVLQHSTRSAMQQIINRLPVNMEDVDQWVQDITKWFRAMLSPLHRPCYPDSVWEERAMYFRALFNLTTDRVTRLRLVHFKACGLMTRMTELLIAPPPPAAAAGAGLDNANIAVMVAAIANVVYEEPTKREMTQEHQAAELLTRLLRNPAPNVLTHAARGVFSLTTVFDFKKIFATQPGLLDSLVQCLQMEPEELITNAAGALANIAIHPESKLPIANNGSLKILIALANAHQSESVLHQTSRCLFSLAAERTNRPRMVQEGVLQAVSRLICLSNVEVLANIIGCLGNLCMSEQEAQNMVNVDRLLAILHKSETVVLDRQTTRILHSFAYRKELRPKFEAHFDSLVNKFLHCHEENVVRDLSGMFCNIVDDDDASGGSGSGSRFRRACCQKQCFPRCIQLSKQLGGVMDTMATLSRFTLLLSEDAIALEWARENADSTIALFTKLAEPPSQRLVAQFSFGVLANFARDEHLARLIIRDQNVVLKRALAALFESDARGKRQQAGKLLANATRRQQRAFADMAEYGGSNGERRRYMDDLRALFKSTYSSCVEVNGGSSRAVVALPGGLRRVEVLGDRPGERIWITLFAPFIDHVFPQLLQEAQQGSSGGGASEQVWAWFFEFLSTRDWSTVANQDVDSGVLEKASALARQLGLASVAAEMDRIKAHHGLLAQQKKEAELFFREESSFEEESTLLGGMGFAPDLASTFCRLDECDVVFRLRRSSSSDASSSASYKELVEETLAQFQLNDDDDCDDDCDDDAMDEDDDVHRLRAHRHVLAARCSYFRALFENEWADSQQMEYDVPSSSFFFFPLLLRYVYFGLDARLKDALMQDKALARAVLAEANLYILPGLQHYCEWSLSKMLLVALAGGGGGEGSSQVSNSSSSSSELAESAALACELVRRNAPLLKLDLALYGMGRGKDWARALRAALDDSMALAAQTARELLAQVGLDDLELAAWWGDDEDAGGHGNHLDEASDGEDDGGGGGRARSARKRQRLEEEPPQVDLNGVFL